MRVLAAVFYLGRAGKPVAKGEDGLPRPPKVPAVNEAVDGTSRQHVMMVGREIDVGDGSAVGLERVLDGAIRRVLPEVEVPDQDAMVGRRGYPVVSGGERRPLDVDDQPWRTMAPETAGGIVRGV